MLATITHFTGDAVRFRNEKASRYDLHLKDYESVLERINSYRPNLACQASSIFGCC